MSRHQRLNPGHQRLNTGVQKGATVTKVSGTETQAEEGTPSSSFTPVHLSYLLSAHQTFPQHPQITVREQSKTSVSQSTAV